MSSRPDLTAAAIWTATLEILRVDFWTLFAVAAPFTLLVDMAVGQFGPEAPKTMAELTPQVTLVLVVIPAMIGAVAQLAVAHMVARPQAGARPALAAAFAAWPVFMTALLLSALPTGLGFLLLVVPGLYIAARLFLMVPVAVLERPGAVATLRRSWDLTGTHAWAIFGFFVLTILFLLGASLLAGGVGAALGSVLTLVGMKAVGAFVAALVTAVVASAFSIASAVAATVIYLRVK